MNQHRQPHLRPCTRDGCARTILWAKTELARPMPLDPEPNEAGNVAAYKNHAGNWYARVLRKDEQPYPYEARYMPHFATCTAAKVPASH